MDEVTGVPPSGSGCQPAASAADASSQSGIPNAYGEPVSTIAELNELDSDEIIEGYFDGRRNEPEPTGNRSRSYWHGWRNGMADGRHMPIDGHMRQLAHAIIEQSRQSATALEAQRTKR